MTVRMSLRVDLRKPICQKAVPGSTIRHQQADTNQTMNCPVTTLPKSSHPLQLSAPGTLYIIDNKGIADAPKNSAMMKMNTVRRVLYSAQSTVHGHHRAVIRASNAIQHVSVYAMKGGAATHACLG